MLSVNGKEIAWFEGIAFSDILRNLGYKDSNPRVIIRVDGTAVSRKNREDFELRDGMELQVINIVCGG